MKAVVIHEYGGTDKLKYETIAQPTVTTDQDVIIKTNAIGVNPADYKMRKGLLKHLLNLKLPIVLGIDFAGTVVQVGAAVERVKVGDEVFGRISMPQQVGAYAEYVKANAKNDAIVIKPATVSFEVAGGLPVPVLTAYTSLVVHGKLKEGTETRVLVVGASGAVGYWAVQIAKVLKAHVTGICSLKNMEYVKQAGSDCVLDYTSPSFIEDLKTASPFDIVVDTVGGDDYWFKIAPLISKGGVYSTAVGPNGGDVELSLPSLIGPLQKLAWRSMFGRVSYKWILALAPTFPDEIIKWLTSGELKQIKTITFPLQDAFKAHELSATGRTVGKIVLLP